MGRFEIRGRLAESGLGVVFDAALPDGRSVALKLIRPEPDPERMAKLTARLQRELRILRRLKHPGIVSLVEAGDFDGILYMAVERVPGKTLSAVLKHGPLEPDVVVKLGLELADTLAHLHAVGLVHRDIKPDSVILSTSGTPILCDLGFARMSGTAVITRSRMIVGSLGYIAPEIIDGGSPSAKSDQFALGRLLFNLLTPSFDRPLAGPTIVDQMRASLLPDWTRYPRSPAHAALGGVIERMVRVDPAERYPNLYLTILDLARVTERSRVKRKARTSGARSDDPGARVLEEEGDGGETVYDPTPELAKLSEAAVDTDHRALSADLLGPAGLPVGDFEVLEGASERSTFVSTLPAFGLATTTRLEERADDGETLELIEKLRSESTTRGRDFEPVVGGVIELVSAGLLSDARLGERELRRRTARFWKTRLSESGDDASALVAKAVSGADGLLRWNDLVSDLVPAVESAPKGAGRDSSEAVKTTPTDAIIPVVSNPSRCLELEARPLSLSPPRLEANALELALAGSASSDRAKPFVSVSSAVVALPKATHTASAATGVQLLFLATSCVILGGLLAKTSAIADLTTQVASPALDLGLQLYLRIGALFAAFLG